MPKRSRSDLEIIDELQRLVEAIDRRVPQLQRLTEPAIALDAADLRARAVALIEALRIAMKQPTR